jgi:uncharacterized delta-60 repeat protein
LSRSRARRLVSILLGLVSAATPVPSAGATTKAGAEGDAPYLAQLRVRTDFDGGEDAIRALVTQPDGRLVAGGEARLSHVPHFALARYLPDGSLDPSFGDHGRVTTPIGTMSGANAVALQADGRLVVAGCSEAAANQGCDFTVARYRSDGRLDRSFGRDGIATTSVGLGSDIPRAAIIQPDGRLVVAGETPDFGGSFAVVRYEPDGRLDPTFGRDGVVISDIAYGHDVVEGLLDQPDGKVIAVGRAGSDGFLAMARYRTDGTLDPTFGDGGVVKVPAFGAFDSVLQPDGRILVGGGAAGYQPAGFVARFLPDGSFDASFGDGGHVTTLIGVQTLFRALMLQPNGKIIAAGTANKGGDFRFAVARYTPDGSLDPSFGPVDASLTDFTVGTDEAYAVTIDGFGRIVTGGVAGFADGRSNGDFALVGLGLPVPVPVPSSPAPVASPSVNSILGSGPAPGLPATGSLPISRPTTNRPGPSVTPVRPRPATAHPAPSMAGETPPPSGPPSAPSGVGSAPAPEARPDQELEVLARLQLSAARNSRPLSERLPAAPVALAIVAVALAALGTAGVAYRRPAEVRLPRRG